MCLRGLHTWTSAPKPPWRVPTMLPRTELSKYADPWSIGCSTVVDFDDGWEVKSVRTALRLSCPELGWSKAGTEWQAEQNKPEVRWAWFEEKAVTAGEGHQTPGEAGHNPNGNPAGKGVSAGMGLQVLVCHGASTSLEAEL